MKKKFFAALLAMAMVLVMVPFAMADNTTEQDDTGAVTPATELPTAKDGVITLTKNVELSSTWTVHEDTILNLNGYTLSYTGTSTETSPIAFVEVESGTLTVRDSSKAQTGKISVDEEYYQGNGNTSALRIRCIQVQPGASFTLESGTLTNTNTASESSPVIFNHGTVIIDGGTVTGVYCISIQAPVLSNVEDANGTASCIINDGKIIGIECDYYKGNSQESGWSWGVCLFGPGFGSDGTSEIQYDKATLTMNGGTIQAGQGIGTNASSGRYAGNTITINNGTIEGAEPDGTAMYLPAIGKTTINGGTITGAQGIRICAGELTINGGTINGTAVSDGTDLIAGGSGGTKGALVIGKASTGYIGDIVVNIGQNATIQNTAVPVEGQENPAIVVSDKNMGNTTSQNINDPAGNKTNATFTYSNTPITVSVDGATIYGDVIKVSNLEQEDKTQDGGNTSLVMQNNTTVGGDVINQSQTGLTVKDSTISGNVTNTSTGNTALLGTTVKGNVTDSSEEGATGTIYNDGAEPGEGQKNIVAVNENTATTYSNLSTALSEAKDGNTIVLVDDVTLDNLNNSATVIDVTGAKNVTIQSAEGHQYTISATYTKATTTADQSGKTSPFVKIAAGASLTIENVNLNFTGNDDGKATVDGGTVSNVHSGTGFDLGNGASLTLNNANVTLNTMSRGFISGVGNSEVTVSNSTVTANGLSGNFSNGGTWTVEKDSTVDIRNVGNHGLSTDTLTVSDSKVTVNNAGYLGILGSEITLDNADVSVTNSAKAEGVATTSNGTYADKGAVQLKGADATGSTSKLTITDSTLTLSGNGNSAEGKTIYVGNAAVDINANSTVNGVLARAESATGHVVTFVSNGTQLNTTVVTTGSVAMIAEPTRTGYTFGGWQSSADNRVYRPGVNVPITADTTFTAVWNAIVVDPGERITITTPSNGSVAVSPSGGYAPAGSTVTLTVTPDRGYELGALIIRGGSSTVPYTDLGNGRYSFVMPEGGVTVSAVFTRIRFTDVPAGEWYYNAVYWAVENGVTDGTSDTLFSPERDVTRAEMVTFLWRAAGSPEPTTTVNPFEDVSSSAYYYDAVLWAVENGITDGVSETEFDPTGECTRAQMVTFLWRAAGQPDAGTSNPFTDVDEEEYYYEAILWAAANGITDGMTDTTFVPGGNCTRAQAVTFLYRTMV